MSRFRALALLLDVSNEFEGVGRDGEALVRKVYQRAGFPNGQFSLVYPV